jgi:hypothetical protein
MWTYNFNHSQPNFLLEVCQLIIHILSGDCLATTISTCSDKPQLNLYPLRLKQSMLALEGAVIATHA